MTRLPLVGDDTPDADLHATFAFVRENVGRVPNLYRTLGHAPNLLSRWIEFAWALRNEPTTDRGLRELAILRTAQLNGTDYEYVAHVPMARASGISDAQIDALEKWRDSDAFSEPQRAVLEMADQLASTTNLTDDAWSALATHFDERAIIELVLTTSFYACVSRVLGALEVPMES
jgi:uncharacterized peroxidase-related enzyme